MKKQCAGMLKLIVLTKALILISACGINTVKDSYCVSIVPMRGYLYLETSDPALFNEIHQNMKRFVERCTPP